MSQMPAMHLCFPNHKGNVKSKTLLIATLWVWPTSSSQARECACDVGNLTDKPGKFFP